MVTMDHGSSPSFRILWCARRIPKFINDKMGDPAPRGRIQSPLEGQRDFAIAQPANLAQIPPVPLKKQVVASLRLHLLKFYGTPGRIPIDKLRTSSPAAYGFEVQESENSKMS
jgi:hypothetical protein